jgi:DNA-binding beta-propeller fold protein YncE
VKFMQAIKGEFVFAIGSRGVGEFGNSLTGLSLTPDETRLLVCDGGSRRVVMAVPCDGRSFHTLRGPTDTFVLPVQAIVVPQTGQVLVLDNVRSRVFVFASVDDDTVVCALGDGFGRRPLQLNNCASIAVLDGDVSDAVAPDGPVAVIADSFNHRLALWRVCDGTLVRHLGSEGNGPGQFNHPNAVAVVPAGATGNAEAWLVVADDYRVQVMTRTGAVVRELRGDADIKLGRWLSGVTVSVSTGEVLVTDTENHRVVSWRIADGGGLRVVCGGWGSYEGRFNQPYGLAVSRDGALWVADAGNSRLCCFA